MSRPLLRYAKWSVSIVLIGVLIVGAVAALRHPGALDPVIAWIQQSGWRGPFAFVALYTVGAMIFLPGSVLTLAGGMLFGPVAGSVYSLVGAVLGATLSFLIARYWAHDWLSARLSRRLQVVTNRLQASGWRLVALTRLIPLLPFGIVNYGLGALGLRLAHFVTASIVCMAPGTIAYSYMGYVGHQALRNGDSVVFKAGLGLACLVALIAIPLVIDWARRQSVPDRTECVVAKAEPGIGTGG